MPFRTRSILVASDLSESARRVLNAASALSQLTEAELHVVHAMEPAHSGEPQTQAPEGSAGAMFRALQDQLRRALPAPVEARSARVLTGRADEVILRRAEEVHADLVVIGPHRRGPQAGGDLGATADRLVRTSALPCLIIHASLSLPLQRVLVPSDLSEASTGALDIALIWSAALRMPRGSGGGTQVEVLHVRLTPPEGGAAQAAPAEELQRALEGQVASAAERSGVASPLRLRPVVTTADDAAAEILRTARDERVDLLVLGTHGESGQRRERIGSVSSAVARDAESPVLMVPPALWKVRQAREETLRRGEGGGQPSG